MKNETSRRLSIVALQFALIFMAMSTLEGTKAGIAVGLITVFAILAQWTVKDGDAT